MINPMNPFESNYCKYRTPCNYCSRKETECTIKTKKEGRILEKHIVKGGETNENK